MKLNDAQKIPIGSHKILSNFLLYFLYSGIHLMENNKIVNVRFISTIKELVGFILIFLSVSLHGQEKRLIGRIDGKKLYLLEHRANDGNHFWNSLFVLSDTSIATTKDLESFDGENLVRQNKNILQFFGPFGDEFSLLDQINLETTYMDEGESNAKLIIPFVFQDSRFGSPKTIIKRVYNWDKTKKQFIFVNELSINPFSERVAEIQGLLFKNQYHAALKKIKQEVFYEVWNAYPGCENYYYPQNLFLDFIDKTHQYASKKLKDGNTLQAAKLSYELLNEPLFKYEFKNKSWLSTSTFTVLPFLAFYDKYHQYNVNIINPCRSTEDWSNPKWMDNFKKEGYLLFFSNSIELYNLQGHTFSATAFDFIPNDPEYTLKLNDLAYFLEQGGYDSLATVILKQIVYHHPNRTVAYLNLGDALFDLGEKSQAKNYYKNYIALCRQKKMEAKIPKRVFSRI
jgi:hypothetical protein